MLAIALGRWGKARLGIPVCALPCSLDLAREGERVTAFRAKHWLGSFRLTAFRRFQGNRTLEDMTDAIPQIILEPKKAEFVRGIVAGKSAHAAALAAGYKSHGAGSKLLSDENLRLALKQAALEMGNTPEQLGITLREAREAMRTELDREGNVVELGPDHRSRIQATDITIKMLGGYPKPGADIDINAQNVLVIRADQGLAASDPFMLAGENEGGTEVLPMSETLSESPYTRHDFDTVT